VSEVKVMMVLMHGNYKITPLESERGIR
jgi:hypothetical protein